MDTGDYDYTYPLGDTHNNATLYEDRKTTLKGLYYYVIIWWIMSFFVSVSIILYFLFEKQRRFPACVGGLMSCFDLLYIIRELLQFSPIDSLQEALFWNSPPGACRFLFIYVAFVESGVFALAIALCGIIYLTTVRKMDLKNMRDERWFKITAVGFCIYPLVYTLLIGLIGEPEIFPAAAGTCVFKTAVVYILGVVQCGVAVLVEGYLLGASAKYINQIIRNAHTQQDQNQKRVKINIRFVVFVVFQTLPRIAYNAQYMAIGLNSPSFFRFIVVHVVVVTICYPANAAVLLWCNKGLWDIIRALRKKNVVSRIQRVNSTTDTSDASL